MKRPIQSGGSPGFTLLEVVVAMAIVGLGVVILLELFSQGLRLGTRSSVETETMAYGRQVLDEVLARPRIESGALQGSFGNRGRWQLRVREIREPERTLSLGTDWELKEIILSMRLLDGNRERVTELKTLKLTRKSEQ